MGADIGPSRAGFELVAVFDRRRDPTALLILFRQFCLALPPVLEVRLDSLVTREPSVDVVSVVPVSEVSGIPVGGTASDEDILRFALW